MRLCFIIVFFFNKNVNNNSGIKCFSIIEHEKFVVVLLQKADIFKFKSIANIQSGKNAGGANAYAIFYDIIQSEIHRHVMLLQMQHLQVMRTIKICLIYTNLLKISDQIPLGAACYLYDNGQEAFSRVTN